MKRNVLLFESLYFLILTGCLHFLALYLHLYWELSWFDIIVHFSGGISAGFFMLWFASLFTVSSTFLFLSALIGTSALAILWELFEYHFGLTFSILFDYRLETFKDMVVGVIGGLCAYGYFYFKIKSLIIIKKVQNKI